MICKKKNNFRSRRRSVAISEETIHQTIHDHGEFVVHRLGQQEQRGRVAEVSHLPGNRGDLVVDDAGHVLGRRNVLPRHAGHTGHHGVLQDAVHNVAGLGADAAFELERETLGVVVGADVTGGAVAVRVGVTVGGAVGRLVSVATYS